MRRASDAAIKNELRALTPEPSGFIATSNQEGMDEDVCSDDIGVSEVG